MLRTPAKLHRQPNHQKLHSIQISDKLYTNYMGRPTCQIRRKRKILSISALATYFGVHRHTMRKKIAETGTDLFDIYSIFDFIKKHATNSTTD